MFDSWSRDYTRRTASDIKRRVDDRRKAFAESSPGSKEIFHDPAFRLLLRYLRPRLPAIAFISFLNLIKAVLDGARIIALMLILGLIVGESVDAGSDVSVLGLELPLDYLLNLFGGENGLVLGLVVLVGITLGVEGLVLFAGHLARKIQTNLSYQVRADLVKQLFRLKLHYFDDNKSGDIAYLQNGLVGRFVGLLPSVQALISAGLDLSVALIILALMSGWLVLLLGTLGLLAILAISRMERRVTLRSFEAEEASRIAATQFLETIYGIRLIKQGGQEERVSGRYLDLAWDREASLLHLQDYQALSHGVVRFGGMVALLLAAYGANLLYGLNLLQNVGLGLGYLYLAIRVFGGVNIIQSQRLRIARMLPQFMIVAEFLLDQKHVETFDRIESSITAIEEHIRVENLEFRYMPEKGVLNNVTLDFPKGTITALVGLSGSGKTTLLELLAGIRVPQNGRILVDGEALSASDLAAYRPLVGYVNQETILFHDTLLENIRYLRPEATFEDIEWAVQMTMAEDFISDAGRGYDTMVGERGARISGGQRQRIVLARVLLQDSRVLLLDEATSSLDLYTEASIHENLMRLKENKIVVVAAHRLSAITRFDNIVVLNDGRVLEQGTHAELISAGGLYYHLYSLQEYTQGDYSTVPVRAALEQGE